jgi:CopA family copper-resistance protein
MQGDYYNYNQPTIQGFAKDVKKNGLDQALTRRQMWNQMRMSPTDLADLSDAVLTYLLNGSNPASNWRGLYNKGERVRLRFNNGSSNTFFDVRIPGLQMSVVQADGQNVKPVWVDEFRFGPGETYDVLIEPNGDAYTLFAQSMDRSGYARGTLAINKEAVAPVPATDPVEWLTMTDMMGNMTHGAGAAMTMGGMEMGGEKMDHSSMNHGGSAHGGMSMDHQQHKMGGNSLSRASSEVRHASTEYGPSVDMRVDMPRTNLDDPGIGLRNHGRKVLTLADLHSIEGVVNHQSPEAEIELHLTGNMERYSWSIDGLEFGKSTPVHMKHHQRVRVILQNDTMMTHPMHLHGMWSDLENEQGQVQVRRHTIPVQPAQRISFLTTPHDVGRWAWHCHLLFHMDAGMFREVIVS